MLIEGFVFLQVGQVTPKGHIVPPFETAEFVPLEWNSKGKYKIWISPEREICILWQSPQEGTIATVILFDKELPAIDQDTQRKVLRTLGII